MRRILAILILGIGGWLSYILLNPQAPSSPVVVAEDEAEQPVVTTEIFVAKNDLRQGVFLIEGNITTGQVDGTSQQVLEMGYFPIQSYTMEEFSGSIIRSPVATGSPLSSKNVSLPRGHGFLAAVVMPDMRAMVIPIAEGDPSANHVFPGDHVDVILVASLPQRAMVESLLQGYTPPNASELRRSLEIHHGTILENVRVIAVDSNIQGVAPLDFGVARKPGNVTLEVTPRQVEIATLARELGSLSLSLRSPGHDPIKGADHRSLYDRLEPMVDIMDTIANGIKKPMRIMRAGGTSEYIVDSADNNVSFLRGNSSSNRSSDSASSPLSPPPGVSNGASNGSPPASSPPGASNGSPPGLLKGSPTNPGQDTQAPSDASAPRGTAPRAPSIVTKSPNIVRGLDR